MIYNFNGKKLNINDKELEKSMQKLGLTKEEAIEMWLEDEGYLDNEEQIELTKKAKNSKITATIHGASAEKPQKKTQKERVKKENPTKKGLIDELFAFLPQIGATNVQIVNETKLITFKIGEKDFKLDLIETRQKKK